MRWKRSRNSLKSFSSMILSVSEDYYFLSVTALNTSPMIAISMFMKVIWSKNVPKMKVAHKTVLLMAPL